MATSAKRATATMPTATSPPKMDILYAHSRLQYSTSIVRNAAPYVSTSSGQGRNTVDIMKNSAKTSKLISRAFPMNTAVEMLQLSA